MLTFYVAGEQTLQAVPIADVPAHLPRIVWVDMLQPTAEEESYVEKLLSTEIPTRDEMHEIELSSRLYQENGIVYATASLVVRADTANPETHAITFVLMPRCLISVRYVETQPFKTFVLRAGVVDHQTFTGSTILAGLMEAIVDRIADVLERIGHNIDQITRDIFPVSPADLARVGKTDFMRALREIGFNGDLVSRTRESLVSVTRLLGFVSQSSYFKSATEDQERLQVMLRDISALSDHANFLSGKVSFLLDATLGMIQIEQNDIIKIFSVAAVVFLPPTLIASIYGMNFHYMPELGWRLGYPMALLLMVLSAYLPYKYVRRKRWL